MGTSGRMFLITGPSGVGKKTLMTRIFENPKLNLIFSVSFTTRKKRPGEKDGVDYFFVTKQEFMKKVKEGKMLEHAHFFNNYYGTSKEFVDERLNAGKNVVIEIETMGFRQVSRKTSDFASIFIMPPSIDELRKRLLERGTETPEEVELRLKKAEKEMAIANQFTYVLVNDDFEKAVEELENIFLKEITEKRGNRVRCAAIDVDGTLIEEGIYDPVHISEDNISEIKKFCNSGGKIVLSTGRDFRNADAVCRHLYKRGIPMESIPYMVCLNGAMIVDNKDHKSIIWRHHFDPALCRRVVDFLEKKKLSFLLVSSENEMLINSNPFTHLIYWYFKISGKFVYKKKPLFRNTNLDMIQKIMVFKKMPRVKELKKEIMSTFGDGCYCSLGPKFYLEIVDKEVDKFVALKEVSRLLKIPISEFSAIGNEHNDLRSLEGVGHGVGVDLHRKKDSFSWDEEKVRFHVDNDDRNAVAKAIRELKSRALF